MPPTRLTGHVDVRQERHAAIAVALPAHVPLTRADPGSLACGAASAPEVAGRRRNATIAEVDP